MSEATAVIEARRFHPYSDLPYLYTRSKPIKAILRYPQDEKEDFATTDFQ